MDFGWAIDTIKAGQRVTRKAWAGDPPIYLYIWDLPTGHRTIMQSVGARGGDHEWTPDAEALFADDWQLYVCKEHDIEYADHKKALNDGAKQGMTLEALDTVFAIACQQVPSMADRWQELKAEITIMFVQKLAEKESIHE